MGHRGVKRRFAVWSVGPVSIGLALLLVAAEARIALAAGGPAAALPPIIIINEGVVAPAVARERRQAFILDPILERKLSDEWRTPAEGDLVPGVADQKQRWRKIQADASGEFPAAAVRGRYLVSVVAIPDDRIMILEAAGHSQVQVNGKPHCGDVYRTGYVKIPVALHQGVN